VVKVGEEAGATMALRIATVTASTPEELDRALAGLGERRPDALLVGSALLFWMHRLRIVDFCAQHRIPASHGYGEVVREGGLTSYAASLEDTFRIAGTFVARILGGAQPADLPVEQPTTLELVVNRRTADALGLTIPPPVLMRADEILD
jgi:putative ABC transport system substrate-binding protein